ncbi:MAG: carbonic anhydrase [Frankiales bacterium]|nr:carbonic anhydrase [Frankiales bacterium]MDX6244539.1 carbonic anhydrase [Frankiales bacterium]
MDLVQKMLEANAGYVSGHGHRELDTQPVKHLAVVTCMDSRIDAFSALGLDLGEAHILRNAGGVVTDDTIRSLTLSQRALGTRHIVLIHHTRCGLLGVDEDDFRQQMLEETGMKPPWSLEAFTDLEADLRSSVTRVKTSPYLPYRDSVYGLILDVDSGELIPIDV